MAISDYRTLGRSGLRVSPLCLGTMTFGTDWGWGADASVSRQQFDLYVEKGGNFLDTANFYTEGTSERLLGEYLKGRRDEFVLATKYTLNMRQGDPNSGGHGRKSLFQNLHASLERLGTDHVDLYWVHMDDGITPMEETMRALDDAVRQGKVRHVGVSDTPAWKVARMNTLAEWKDWSPFVGLQIEYSLIERTVEGDLVPMAVELGLGVTPWSPLGMGVLSGKYTAADLDPATASEGEGRHARNMQTGKLNARTLAIADEAKAVGAELGVSASRVSVAWLMSRTGVASTILGARTLAQLEDTLAAAELVLPAEHLARLDAVSRPEPVFPHSFLGEDFVQAFMSGGTDVTRGY